MVAIAPPRPSDSVKSRPETRRVAHSEAWTDLEAAWNRAMFAAFAELQKKREAARQKVQEPDQAPPPAS